jgi:hypothetical protein
VKDTEELMISRMVFLSGLCNAFSICFHRIIYLQYSLFHGDDRTSVIVLFFSSTSSMAVMTVAVHKKCVPSRIFQLPARLDLPNGRLLK